MVAYCALAALAAEAGQARWPSKPKWHVSCPIIIKFISFMAVGWDQQFGSGLFDLFGVIQNQLWGFQEILVREEVERFLS